MYRFFEFGSSICFKVLSDARRFFPALSQAFPVQRQDLLLQARESHCGSQMSKICLSNGIYLSSGGSAVSSLLSPLVGILVYIYVFRRLGEIGRDLGRR